MTYRKSVLSAAIVTCLAFNAQAQESTDTGSQEDATDLETVTVVGIRGSVQRSLDTKREAQSHVEVVTAEDIGKLPAKNVADTLQRLPGVNISSSSATEGGFDESDRISLRGTSPSLTQTLVNGHTVGTGDWFVLSQVQTVGRSVSYSLLPAEIVSQVVVHKTSQAKLTEGGSAGSVDIITRRPLQFADNLTLEATVGGVYADLPSETDPQFNGLFNWKNDAGNVGVLFQAFYEKRSLRRDGQEVVGGYGSIPTTLPDGSPNPLMATNPDLANVLYPNLTGSVLFEQERERKGGVLDIQVKATDNLTLGLSGFYSKLEADNYNRNYMMWASRFVPFLAPQAGYQVVDGVLTNAQYAQVTDPGLLCGPNPTDTCMSTPFGVYDQISRPGASSESKYLTLDADWQATDNLGIKFQAGTTEGHGRSPTQDVMELGINAGAGAGWAMHGIGNAIDWHLGGDNASPSGIRPQDGWIFGGQGIDALDEEQWAQADAELFFSGGALATLDFGVRYAEHTRENLFEVAQGPNFDTDWQNPANYPTAHQNYPGDFGSDIGGSFPSDIWYWTPEQLAAINAQFANRDPVERFFWQDLYSVKEKASAAYVQANFQGDRWSGNVGLRYVRTQQRTLSNVGVNPNLAPEDQPEGTVNGSAFGPYLPTLVRKTYNELLPSANFKYELSDDLVLRLAASKTLTRPDYSALAGAVSLDDLTHTGSGGNPDLDPIVSTNLDASLEWYFAPRALLAASIFQMDMNDYVAFGTDTRQYLDQAASAAAGEDVFADYQVSIPVNTDAKVKGVELTYEQPIGENFGVAANYTYADSDSDGVKPVFGTSKNTYNVSGYYESDRFNARLSYTHRSEFYAGVSRTDDFFQESVGNLALSLGYNVNDWMSISLDGLNLNNPELKYYSERDGMALPYAIYSNGRQYYLNFRFKF
ncbi:TonB-dependent receptor [Luteimonas salinilitoris]|uniref:TonB-dependent receptor n=1 Tax=Luteimonas salinilitoris TaxID=3237697 RepID=A0ABV4HSP9_9GAMM